MHRYDVGVIELPHDLRLTQESTNRGAATAQFGAQSFESDIALQAALVSAIDDGHAPGGDFGDRARRAAVDGGG